ncbi:MAG TPA: asparagine synthase-related protein, partial [Casimicrobiaceae bacterium]|nr:asparagine synthase-related protein [Casimicrobiaceae bacterium]
MSGIFGWINLASGDESAHATLDAMRQGLRDNGADAPRPIINGLCALAAEPGIRAVDLHETQGLLAAVEGQIRWRSENLGVVAREHGVAAAVVEAYRLHGTDCLKQMLGPFAIAIADARNGSGLLAIDRLGIRTLCYANPPGGLVFGSNATSVVAHRAVERDISKQAIFNYLYFHVIPSPGTIYRTVQKLEPGECIVFRNGVVERRFYWQLRYHDEGAGAVDALERRFRSMLKDATKHAIDGDSDVGTFLSGGTDSSTVATMLTELTRTPARTYSIGFASDEFDEMKYARITAKHL